GAAAVLRQAGGEARAVDGGGGPEADGLHPRQRRALLLARRAQARRPAALRQELPPPLDQLPPPRPQARPPHRRRGAARRRPPRQARQQVWIWSKIAAKLPGRTDNEIKNHWNTHIKKKLIKMGIDPITHEPLEVRKQPQQASLSTTSAQSSTITIECKSNNEDDLPAIGIVE
uniref:Uncharacterized protein n=1 Tax=Aegilops tauschii subsp. strangulata TaxID=200361 RepID=A0A453LEV8_AEGTS